MKITDVKTTRVRIPLLNPVKWSGGIRRSAPAMILEIHTDEGIVGLGECVGPTLPTVETLVNHELRQFLIGQDPMRIERLVRRMEEFTRHFTRIAAFGISGIEMALMDIKGKALGTSVYNLLGGRCRSDIRYMGYLFIDTPQANAKKALAYRDEGYTEIKLKVGRDLNNDIDTLAAIRDAVGSTLKIRVDANMNWSVPTAIKWIKAMTPFDIQYVEQPVPDYDLDAMAAVRRAVDVPIAADEGCSTLQSAIDLIKHDACDVFVIYVSEAGGLTRASQIAALADACGKWCAIGTWAETGVATAAGAHVIAASANFPFANDTHYMLQTDDVISPQLPLKGGRMALPEGPGLGVALDPAKLEMFSRDETRESVFFDNIEDEDMPLIGQIL